MAAGGFAITASHNPVIWNGIKIIDLQVLFYQKSPMICFMTVIQKQLAPLVGWDQQGCRIDDNNALSTHGYNFVRITN